MNIDTFKIHSNLPNCSPKTTKVFKNKKVTNFRTNETSLSILLEVLNELHRTQNISFTIELNPEENDTKHQKG